MRNLAWCMVVAVLSIGPPIAEAAMATTWYVDIATCSGSGSGTQLDPFCAIQEGLDFAGNGDTVLVADGTYTGIGNRDLDFAGKAITLRSIGGATNCIIDAGGSAADHHRGFDFDDEETEASIVNGFTITGGYATYGGGIRCNYGASPTLCNCVLSGNAAQWQGGGLYNTGNPTLTNCLFAGNEAEAGGGLYSEHDSPVITNCTFTGNRASVGGGISFKYVGESVMLTDCVVWGNVPASHQLFAGGGRPVDVAHSCIAGGYPGTGNIGVDPKFLSPGYWDANDAWVQGDLHLQPGSPCIDAGDDGSIAWPNDLTGRTRKLDGDGDNRATVDMGAYEFKPALCGNGVIDPTETCDDMGASATCDADCTEVACGDGMLNTAAGESCDDGNTKDGDGCPGNCVLAVCSDGVRGPGEECDDSNKVDGDGCSSTCALEGIPCETDGDCAWENNNACEWDHCGSVTPGICDPPIPVMFGDVAGHGAGTPPNGIVNVFDFVCALNAYTSSYYDNCPNADVVGGGMVGECPHGNRTVKLDDFHSIRAAYGPLGGSTATYLCDCPENPY